MPLPTLDFDTFVDSYFLVCIIFVVLVVFVVVAVAIYSTFLWVRGWAWGIQKYSIAKHVEAGPKSIYRRGFSFSCMIVPVAQLFRNTYSLTAFYH